MKFSILIAHYNNYNYFKQCYESLKNQTYKNFEIILVDDCSTDGSFEKIIELTKNDDKIKTYKNEENKGVGFTKRRCVELSSGEICGFVDPDDALTEDAIEISIKAHNNDCIATYSQFYSCDENLKIKKIFRNTTKVENNNSLFFNIHFEVAHFFAFKKSVYLQTEGINVELTSAVDQDLYLKLYEKGDFLYIKKTLYLYRLHEKGVSQEKTKKIKLNSNWHTTLLHSAKRRNISKLFGEKIDDIENLPKFIFQKREYTSKKNKKKTQMVNIFIKSFNRPFYLDRCLQSIENFVEGDFCVKVLDDGTPEIYLSKIKEKHPQIEIIKSENYQNKVAAIAENLQSGKEIDGFTIPTNLWYKAAKNASDYFMMIEDDVWFTHKINVNDLQETCQKNQISLLKLGWLGNKKDDESIEISEITEEILRVEPKNLLLFPEFFNDLFFYNKFKFFTILYKLGIVDNATKRKYWALNSILMGFWQKEYWLHIWKNAKGKVDEKQQLRNASNYYRKHQDNPNFIARLEKEALKTTFQSSATNSYHKYGDDFDVNYFNHLINQAWLNGSFDEMQNFPKDFSLEYFEKFSNEKIDKTAFRNWVLKFKNQYKNLGCEVE